MDWIVWRDSLQSLEQLEIPRAYTAACLSTAQHTEVHIFSDASVKAIAAVAYLRLTDGEGKCHVGFIFGKAKMAPTSAHTVPRLELGAAILAVEIAELVVRELDIDPNNFQFHTDSKVVLGYIYNETRRFYVHVSNRVERIRKSTRPEQWHYVPTTQNPADVATRSVPAARLTDTIWLIGPALLTHSVETNTTEDGYDLIEPDTDVEVQSHSTTATESHRGLGSHCFERFSTRQSLLGGMASLIHVGQSFGSKKDNTKQECSRWHHCTKPNTAEVLAQAKAVIIRCVRKEAYKAEVSCLEKGEVFLKTAP